MSDGPVNGDANPHQANDSRLDAAIAAYLRARSGGRPVEPDAFASRYDPPLRRAILEFAAAEADLVRAVETVSSGPVLPPAGKLELAPGDNFGDFEIEAEVGRGGMGIVYRARQKSLGRLVALKVMGDLSQANEEDVRRFRLEARATAVLHHPGIVRVHEAGCIDGRLYFMMDLLEGGGLPDRLDEYVGCWRKSASLVAPLAQSVQFCHEHGILHRDLKPANVLFDASGSPCLTDFGLAKRLDGGIRLTATGQAIGTLRYMAPEQLRGVDDVVPATDVYGLGVILYSVLTAMPPLRADSPLGLVRKILEERPRSPRQFDPKIPRRLEAICLRCLEKEPARRYATARALADDLESVLADPWPRVARHRSERLWRLARIVAAVCAVGALVVALSFPTLTRKNVGSNQTSEPAAEARGTTRGETYASLLTSAWSSWFAGDTQEASAHLLQALTAEDERLEPPGFSWLHLARRLAPNAIEPRRIELGETIWDAVLSPDGNTSVATGSAFFLSVWRLSSHRPPRLLPDRGIAPPDLTSSCLSADAAWLAIGTRDGSVEVWGLDLSRVDVRRTSVGKWKTHDTAVRGLDFSPGGRVLASWNDAGEVRVWRRPKSAEEPWAEVYRHESGSRPVVAISSQHRLAVAGRERTLVVVRDLDAGRSWDLETALTVLSLAFSPDSHVLAAGLADGALRLWQFSAAGKNPVGVAPAAVLQNAHAAAVTAVAFSTDGRTLVSGARDSTVRCWRLPRKESETLRPRLCGTLKDLSHPVQLLSFARDRRRLLAVGWPHGAKRGEILLLGTRSPSAEDLFRAVYDWAVRRGYKSGFPPFSLRQDGERLFQTVVVFSSGCAYGEVPVVELGNPASLEARFRALQDWAERSGYAAAFPNFHERDYGEGVVYAVFAIAKGFAQVVEVAVKELGDPQGTAAHFRAAQEWAEQNGFLAAYPTFRRNDRGAESEGLPLEMVAIERGATVLEVPTTELAP